MHRSHLSSQYHIKFCPMNPSFYPTYRVASFPTKVHSWNDLSLWSNGFKQGMTHMKIDAHYMSSTSFCLNQKQVTSNSTNGCFVLSHDTPTSKRQYNTTDNVIQFITNNIQLFNSSKYPIFLAVCFKLDSVNPCDSSSQATKWRALTTDLMDSFTNIITKYSLTLQICQNT